MHLTHKCLRALCPHAQTDATGESEHEQLREIEVIFGAFDEIEPLALRQCWNLERLTCVYRSAVDQ